MDHCVRWYLALSCTALALHGNVATGAHADGVIVETLQPGGVQSYDIRRVLDSWPPRKGRSGALRGTLGPHELGRFQVTRDLRGTELGIAGPAQDRISFNLGAMEPGTPGVASAASAPPFITVHMPPSGGPPPGLAPLPPPSFGPYGPPSMPSSNLGPPDMPGMPSPSLGPPSGVAVAMDNYHFEDAPPGQSSVASIQESQSSAQSSLLYWIKTPYSVSKPHVDKAFRVWIPLTADTSPIDEDLATGGAGETPVPAGVTDVPREPEVSAKSVAGAEDFGNARVITKGQIWVMAPFIVGDEHYYEKTQTHFVSIYPSPRSGGGLFEVNPPLPGSTNPFHG